MHLCPSVPAVTVPRLSNGPYQPQVVHPTKLFGVVVDDQFNWKQHVNLIVKAASYKI